uniref:C1q domain-containing protein n=1 Tax=Mola mola TaxID=94237 RepID=A0A3Q3XHW4_MOLML
GELPCGKWDCECAFKRQRGCCCAAAVLLLSSKQWRIKPFTRSSPIPYDSISLNHGNGYNPALIFTAPCSGLYSFSFSVYSQVGREGERMYYKVQLMRNGEVVASTWDNREDVEDSSSQTVLLSLRQGGQVYVELLSGRQLCGIFQGLNIFSGTLISS